MVQAVFFHGRHSTHLSSRLARSSASGPQAYQSTWERKASARQWMCSVCRRGQGRTTGNAGV